MIETMLACPGFDCDENPNLALKLIFSAESETDNYVPLSSYVIKFLRKHRKS